MDESTRATMFSSASGEYQTPPEIFLPVQRRLRLNHDAAASHENHLLPSYSTAEGTFIKHFSTPYKKSESTGLDPGAWAGRRVWCNPPYGRGITDWVKAAALWNPDVAALLLPARTETEWFQRWVAPYAEVHFIMGRLRFVGTASSAPFPSILAVYFHGIWVPRGHIRAFTWDPRTDEDWAGGPST